MTEPREIVRQGYDAIADRYATWSASIDSPVLSWVEKLVARVPAGCAVLELGSGGENAATRILVDRYRYRGVDISPEQVARARRACPEAAFEQADATHLELAPDSFDAVVSLFMLGHVPRAEQEPLLRKILSWLAPGGWLLATMGAGDTHDEVAEDWLGAPMFFASFDERTSRDLLEHVGFDLVECRTVPQEEPGHGPVRFMWVLARKRQ